MILTLLLNTQMISKMSSKILKSTIQEKKCKVLIVFDDMIADIINNKKFVSIVTKKIRGRNINISFVFNAQSYFKVPRHVRLNSMKILNKREVQQIPVNHSSDIDFKDFMRFYKRYTAEPYSFLVNNTTLPSDNPLRFKKKFLE